MSVNSAQGELLLAEALSTAYALNGTVTRVLAGTATDNFVMESESGAKRFVKVYRDHSLLAQEQAAIELAMFARAGGTPVPAIHSTINGQLIGDVEGLALSVWDYIDEAETAEAGLTGERWTNVGVALGRLHRLLAGHPASRPSTRPAIDLCDLGKARQRYDTLIEAYQHRSALTEDQDWALDVALSRRSLLPRVQAMLEGLPPLTVQVLHGDFAAPNLMMRGDEVAALIDFQPPSSQYLVWEIARIGCDPRTIVSGTAWEAGLAQLLDAYRQENPAPEPVDLLSTVSAGCAYTLASSYPLAAPLEGSGWADENLMRYGRARHLAAVEMLEALRGGLR